MNTEEVHSVRGIPNPELKAEAIRLRVEERLSLNAIHRVTGAPKGSLSAWLRGHPLTDEERHQAIRSGRAVGRPGGPKKKTRGEESPLHRSVPAAKLTRQQKAKIAEAATLLRLVMYGYNPFGSVFDGDKTDWLVEVPGTEHVCKVQVKWAGKIGRHGLPCIRLQCRNGHAGFRAYHKGEFDFVVGYDYYTDTCYVWSWDEVANQGTKTIEGAAAERWEKLGR